MDIVKMNEVLIRDEKQWLHFSHPYKIIRADTLNQVIPALTEVEALIEEKKWYGAGFLSYESASAFDPAIHSGPLTGFPYLWFGLYPQPHSVHLPQPAQPKAVLSWLPTMDRAAYDAALTQIQQYIARGETYQVNYTLRLQAEFDINAWKFFLHLAQSQNNHAAYIHTGRYTICSASPELFFELDGETITCRPMKGTARRGRTTEEDHKQAEWLKHSEKNRAENVMIVDMIRSDLGRIAKTGSVRVPQLFCTERYPTLWQMTSTITAQTDASITNILRALFPCASITGAPKVRTMEIIQELETTPRKIYTGAIGYISPRKKARFNVAIRTALIDRETQTAEYGVGGGIVWDSTAAEEYAEATLKARLLAESQPEFCLLETMLWTPAEGFFLANKHIERLMDSAHYFDIPCHRNRLAKRLHNAASMFEAQQRVRLLLDKQGLIKIETALFQPTPRMSRAHLANRPIDSDHVFLFHKTTHRAVYEDLLADFPGLDDVLLNNERGELTEFTIGNLVAELDGQLVTPPIQCGLLPGTFRAHLLETGQVVEKVIPMQRLGECTKIFRVNSVRRWENVKIG